MAVVRHQGGQQQGSQELTEVGELDKKSLHDGQLHRPLTHSLR